MRKMTVGMKKRKKIAIVFIVSILFSNLSLVYGQDLNKTENVLKTQTTGLGETGEEERELTPEEKVNEARNALAITSGAAILMDAASGPILYEKNAYDKNIQPVLRK